MRTKPRIHMMVPLFLLHQKLNLNLQKAWRAKKKETTKNPVVFPLRRPPL